MLRFLKVPADKFILRQNNITSEYFNWINAAENIKGAFSYLGIIYADPQP